MLAAMCHEPKSVKHQLSLLTFIILLYSLFDQVSEYYQRMTAQTCPFLSWGFRAALRVCCASQDLFRTVSGEHFYSQYHTGMGDMTEPSSALQNLSSRLPQEKSPALNTLPENTLEVKCLYFRVKHFTVLFFPGSMNHILLLTHSFIKKEKTYETFIGIQCC